MVITLWLPWPPSSNHYKTRASHGGMMLTARGRLYQEVAHWALVEQRPRPVVGPVVVEITLHPPDRARRDLANYEKQVTDALVGAGVLEDDSIAHVRRMVLELGANEPGGLVRVRIWAHEEAAPEVSPEGRLVVEGFVSGSTARQPARAPRPRQRAKGPR